MLIISEHIIVDQIILHTLHGPNREEGLPDNIPHSAQGGQDTPQEYKWCPGMVPCYHLYFVCRDAVRKILNKDRRTFGQ